MKIKPFKICNEVIQPGEKVSLALPLPELFSCAPLYMPIKIIHGKQAGPCLLVVAAMQGDEYNGTEIVNRLLDFSAMGRLSGTLIAVPVVNVYGLINRSRQLSVDVNLDQCFPGSEIGPHASRVAYTFAAEVFSHADCCINLTTGSINYSNLPQVYLNIKDAKTKSLAEAFNAPVISHSTIIKGSLHALAIRQGKPFITYKAGEALRFDRYAIKMGTRGVLNVMRKLSMLPSSASRHEKAQTTQKAFVSETTVWVHASSSGINHSKIRLGQHIKKGDLLSVIEDPFGAGDDTLIHSIAEGVVVDKNNIPLVHEGNPLYQLAVFPSIQETASHLETWTEKHIEPTGKTKGISKSA
jgi:predicted deacylase